MMIILVDMDNVIADLSGHAAEVLKERHPQAQLVEQSSHFFGKDYPEYVEEIVAFYGEPGFFLGHKPIPGAIQGLRALEARGHTVRICTSYIDSGYCLAEKRLWLVEYAPDFVGKMIFARDKTLVRADILIDDKPLVKGMLEPCWQHWVYDQPYNRTAPGPRISWSDYTAFLAAIEE
jgi:5'-nucleotidase